MTSTQSDITDIMADRVAYICQLQDEAKRYESEIAQQKAMLRKDIKEASTDDLRFTCDYGTARVIAVSGSVDWQWALAKGGNDD